MSPVRNTSIFDEWADEIVRVVSAECSLAGWETTHGGITGNAREAVIRQVLGRFVPSGYEIGSGQVVDCNGNTSRQVDIVISRRDVPAFVRFDGSKLFTVEGVIATMEVKSSLNSKTLTEALDNCHSVGDLCPAMGYPEARKAAHRRGLRAFQDGFIHEDPLETARWECRYRPATYIVGLAGYRKRSDHLKTGIEKWGDAINMDDDRRLAMRHFPSLICTEGCYVWRNDGPLCVQRNCQLLGGRDENPLRLMVSHLLATLYERVPTIADSEGIRPLLSKYLQMRRPQIGWTLYSCGHTVDPHAEVESSASGPSGVHA